MAVSSVGTGSSSLSLVDLLQDAKNENNSILNSSSTLASSNSLLSNAQKAARSAYSGGGSASSAIGQAALKRALSEMGAEGKVTFQDIAEYREQLETEFSLLLRTALAKEGVSLDTEFTLNLDSSGNISVSCDDAVAKEKIEAFLKENEDVCEQFGYIQALSNLERARQSPAGQSSAWSEVRNAKKAYQAEAVEAFFGEALESGMNFSSLLATFNPVTGDSAADSTSFYAGLDFTV